MSRSGISTTTGSPISTASRSTRGAERERIGSHARHLYTLWFDWDTLGLGREQLVLGLRAEGIGTGWHFKVVHLHSYYR